MDRKTFQDKFVNFVQELQNYCMDRENNWKIKYFFLTFVLGFISNLNKNRALRHYPSSGNPQFQDNNWIIHWTLHVLFIY